MELDRVIRLLKRGELIPASANVLCAVSGGADSVALLHILAAAAPEGGFKVTAAHAHHGIRAESDEELEFVTRLCAGLGVSLYTARLNVPESVRQGESIESAARRLRHAFLNETADIAGCDFIAVAHHRRDQAETVLMHALRGASVHGIRGMDVRSGRLIRPLLDVDPNALREYLAQNGLEFREDATNADIKYTRNYVRHVLLNDCERVYAGSVASLCRLAESAARDDDYLNKRAEAAAAEMLFKYGGGQYILKAPFEALHPALRHRVAAMALIATGYDPDAAGVEAIINALNGGSYNFTGDTHISAGNERIYIEGSKAAAPKCNIEVSIPDYVGETRTLCTELGQFIIERVYVCELGGDYGDGGLCQAMQVDALNGAVLRTRRAGDRIRPFGAPGSKKLNDYYTDKKLDRQLRDYMPVIARDNVVLWALGTGVAQEAALTPDDKEAIRIRWDGNGLFGNEIYD